MGSPRRNLPMGLLAGLLALCALCGMVARAAVPVPPLTAHVNDTVGVLDRATREALEARLTAFEAERGAQVAVLVVPTTGGEPIEAYALRVAETWRLGRGKVDDGALLVVALEDRALRIEVGYGLEGVLTDATSKRIIEETLVPAFRAGDFAGGIAQGVERMMAVVAGETLPPPPAPRRGGESPFALALFLAFFCASLFRGLRAAAARGGLAALAAGGGTLLLTQVAGAAGLSALAALVLGLLFDGGGPRGWASHRRYGDRRPGGWTSGGFGGGFSGGGGGFGGGGASGRW